MSIQSVKDVRCLLNEEQLLMLYLMTKEMSGENVEHLMNDEDIVKQ